MYISCQAHSIMYLRSNSLGIAWIIPLEHALINWQAHSTYFSLYTAKSDSALRVDSIYCRGIQHSLIERKSSTKYLVPIATSYLYIRSHDAVDLGVCEKQKRNRVTSIPESQCGELKSYSLFDNTENTLQMLSDTSSLCRTDKQLIGG